MWIAQVAYIIYLSFFLFSFKKAALVLFPFSLLVTTLPLVSIGPAVISLNFALQVSFYLLYFFRKKRAWKTKNFPFKSATIITCAAILLCAVFGETRTPYYVIASSISNALLPMFLWPVLNTEGGVRYLTKAFAAAIVIIVGYGLIEFILQQNIWQDYIQSTTSVTIYHSHMDDVRFGYGRCSSLFDFPIPFGDVCAILFSLFVFLLKHSSYILDRKSTIIVILLCTLGVFLANSRASLVAFLIGMFFLFDKVNVKSLCLAACIIFVVYVFGGDYISDNIASMSGDDEIGGSSADARMRQLEISLFELFRNPIFGGGQDRLDYAQSHYWGSYGLESVIFVLMIGKGLLGLLSYLYTYITLFVKASANVRFPAFIIATAWVVAACFSLTTGVEITFPMMVIVLIIKANQYNLLKMK